MKATKGTTALAAFFPFSAFVPFVAVLAFVPVFALVALIDSASAKAFTKKAVGTTGSDFLNLGVGARALGMAGAYSSIAEGASAVYWNPAGLVQISKLSASFMRADYVADINYQYAAYAHRLGPSSVVAGSILMTDIGRIDRTDMDNTKLGTFSPKDEAYTISYSRAILELSDRERDVSMGVSAKYIKSRIVNSATGAGVDLGVMTYYFTTIPYRISFVLQNLGQGLKFDTHRESLPFVARFGGSLSPFRNLLLATDVVLPKGNSPYMLFGAEFTTEPAERSRISARFGCNTGRISGGLGGITMGMGIGLHFFTIDYAFIPMGELGSTHRISLTFDFPHRNPVFQRRDRSIFTQPETR